MPRAPKQCGHADCPTRVTGRRWCTEHTAQHQRRANTTTRGYGANHQAARTAALANFKPGQACPRCHEPITDPSNVDYDHTDDRTGYLGLAHSRCNARAGALTKTRGGTPPRRLTG